MKTLPLCLLLTSCAGMAPDVVGISTGYGEGGADASFGRREALKNFTTDEDFWWIGPYLEWHIGERARHRESLDQMKENAHRLEVATVTGAIAPVEVNVEDGDGGGLPAGTQTEAPLDNILYAVGAILLAVAGLVGVLVRRMRKGSEE